jgi:hypothetical protein
MRRQLLPAGCFMSMRVVHGLAMEGRTLRRRVFAAGWERSMVALAIIKMVIDVAIKMIRPMEPRPGANEDSTREPLRTIVAIGSTVVGGFFVIPIRAFRGRPDLNRNLRTRMIARRQKEPGNHRSQNSEMLQPCHFVPLARLDVVGRHFCCNADIEFKRYSSNGL